MIKHHYKTTATERELKILRCAGMALSDVAVNTTHTTSFAKLVQHYTGRKYSIEEIEAVLSKSFNDFIQAQL